MGTKNISAIALFSGGLDSILACRIVMDQGINVTALNFVTPFFGYESPTKKKYGIDVSLVDISDKYLALLRDPPHGFGKHFNPCIDCKIMMVREAKRIMEETNASFMFTGEVIGQRSMSQRKDTLRVIERDSGCDGILLRPLCAKSQRPTQAELNGLINRELLFDISGRGRRGQVELAEKFGITDYPNPAGGCVLTDPFIGKRIETFYKNQNEIKAGDIRLLLTGRHYRLPNGGLLTLGRNEAENQKVVQLYESGDLILQSTDRPGPTAILRFSTHAEDTKLAAGIVARFSKKLSNGPKINEVMAKSDNEAIIFKTEPLSDDLFRPWTML
ncbi:MAG: thiamine biosynthesis protein [Thermodesulfobacteriota bacterium]|nr:thiamine biosynthesis protein [Thermodesulfobacteriota bacterium]